MNPWLASVSLALPEVLLAAGAMLLLLTGVFRKRGTAVHTGVYAWLLLAVALITAGIAFANNAGGTGFYGLYIVDGFALFAKVLVFAAALFAVQLSLRYFEAEAEQPFEFYILILLAVVGMGLMISANHVLTLYIGLELQALALYVLAAMRRNDSRAVEAGLKYFVLGALASGMLLYGISLLYGATGHLDYAGISDALMQHGKLPFTAIWGLVFILAGFAFKISAVPFHMWTPDVYEGAPTNVTAFFAVAPKIAALAALIRFLVEPLHVGLIEARQILIFLAVASMLVGAFAALRQDSIKRLLAYSAINHIGYVLLAVAMGTEAAVSSVLLYMALYAVSSIGFFALILCLVKDNVYSDKIGDLGGLARDNPGMAVCGGLLLLSMAGIPPLAGFFGKLFVFESVVASGFTGLAVMGVLASVVAAYYYLRLCKVMFFDAPVTGRVLLSERSLRSVVLAMTGIAALFIIAPQPLVTLSAQASASLFAGLQP